MLEVQLAILGGLSIMLGVASRRARELPLSEPLVALLAGVALGPSLLGWIEFVPDERAHVLRISAQLVLAIALTAVGLRFPLEVVREHTTAILLLITVVLAGMVALSTGLALLFGLGLAPAFLLGAILAPTDPVLASSIVTGEPAERDLPTRLRVLLSMESGANDGLAFVFVGVAAAHLAGASVAGEIGSAAVRLVLALLLGTVAGVVVGRLVVFADQHHEIEHSAFLVLTVALAVFVLGLTEIAGSNGLVAVFVASLAYSHQLSRRERAEEWEVQEAVNRILVLPVFVLLGAVLPLGETVALGWQAVAFVAGVLVLRRLPLLLLARRPLGLSWPEAGFVGWFGPIGVAALFYLADHRVRGDVDDRVWILGLLVIAASTVVHGLTGSPARKRMAAPEGRVG